MPSRRPTWPLVAAATALIGATYGLGRYAYALYLPALRADFGLGAATAGAVASAAYGAYCAGLLAGGAVAERGRARAAAVAAGACAVAGTGAIAIAGSTALLAVGVALGGVSTGLASPALASLIAGAVAPAGRDRAMTVANAGTGFGMLVCAPAALAAPDRWRAGFALFAALSLAVTAAVALATSRGASAHPHPATPQRATAGPRRRARGDRVPLALGAAGLGAAGSAYWTFGRDLLTAAGAGGAGPGLWMALGAASILGAAARDVVPRGRAGALWAALLVAVGASTALLALAPATRPLALASAVVFGASFVALSGILILWATRLDPDRPAAAVSGAFLLLALGGLAGAPVVGALIDHAGWAAGFLAAAGVALGAAPLGYTPAARRALACAASSSASSGSGTSGSSKPRAVAISQSANHAFLGSSGPCR
jgi:predicted MFS family arabinose efflux permease